MRISHKGACWKRFEAVLVCRVVGLDIPESSNLRCPRHLHMKFKNHCLMNSVIDMMS